MDDATSVLLKKLFRGGGGGAALICAFLTLHSLPSARKFVHYFYTIKLHLYERAHKYTREMRHFAILYDTSIQGN